MLVALDKDKERVFAGTVTDRKLQFFCPGCGECVLLKRGRIKIPHFSHKVRGSCKWDAGETHYHIEAKDWLLHYFQNAGSDYKVKLEFTGIEGVRPDVFVQCGDYAVAFEVQHSGISINEIRRRNRVYNRHGVCVMWLLTKDVYNLIRKGEFRMREQNIYLHDGIYHTLYIFTGTGIVAIRMSRVDRWIKEAYNQYGNIVGGYYKTLEKTFKLDKCKEIDLIKDCKLYCLGEKRLLHLYGISKVGTPLKVCKETQEEIK